MRDFIPFIPASTEGVSISIWEAALESWLANLTELLNLSDETFLREIKANTSLQHFIERVLEEQIDNENTIDGKLLRYVFYVYNRLAELCSMDDDYSMLKCQPFCNFIIVFNQSNTEQVRRMTKLVLGKYSDLEENIISIINSLVQTLQLFSNVLVTPIPQDVLIRGYMSMQILQTLLSATLLVDSVHTAFIELDAILIDSYNDLTPNLKKTVELSAEAATYAFLLKKAIVSVFNTYVDYHYFQPLGYTTSSKNPNRLIKVSTANESVLDHLHQKILEYVEKSDLKTTQNAFVDGPLIMDWEVEYHIVEKLDFINRELFHGEDERTIFLKLIMEQVHDSNKGEESWGDSLITEDDSVGSETATQMDTDLENMAKISQIHDLFPDFGEGFIEACLQANNGDTEAVVMQLLEDTLPPTVSNLDRTMQRKALPNEIASVSSFQDLENEEQATALNRNQPRNDGSILSTRHNIYDNDEFDVFNRKNIDTTRVYVGKKDKGTADALLKNERLTEEDKKKVIQRVVDIYDDEYDDTYDDINDAGIPASTETEDTDSAMDVVKRKQEAVDPGVQNESLLVHTFVDNPQLFERGGAVRKSAARAELRKRTCMSDEQLEGWAIMFKRNPRKQRILDKYMLFDGQQEQVSEKTTEKQRQAGKEDAKRNVVSETKDHAFKQKNKARFANHNRKAQRDRKIAKAAPSSN
ncbi:hypothetical protein BDF20DRAFT_916404 [Mycotypha africana]|uniref:uncharacterized protein n=1 Tax=Mycotypha africana TaxID=64632 RepID=UPI002300C45C|nr:uncharacterized protein BDF20DRAFT_916404 [Mycotypha africana]KAI8968985.1 hypothetical protein BDF20DRAFT_916404 [Mycotypha africana]